jgi:hypothetical protein
VARDDADPGLPVKLHPCSNGEYLPAPASPLVREVAHRSRDEAERLARRLGLSRRSFLRSSMGAALVLGTLAACSEEQAAERGDGPGGTYDVAPEAATDPDAALDAVGGEEFVFDVQAHFLDFSHDVGAAPGFPQSGCGEDDPRDCYTVDKFLDLYFNQSDTNQLVLSAVPTGGALLSPEVMAATIELADRLCDDERVLMQGETHPSDGDAQARLDDMSDLLDRYPIAAWKAYTHAGGPGWFLDDHDPSAPSVGEAFLDHIARTHADGAGPRILAVHKGFSGGSRFADPVDVGPAAAAHPDLAIVVYHSGFEGGPAEGPYDAAANRGVDRLITSLRAAGLGPGGNVYAELGSTWRSVMGDPDQAAHVLGKLLVAFGEDNVVWGTDSIWYGSPQDQIQAFRAFQISEEYQERFGYPTLTPEVKAKILGLTSARLYGIDPLRTRCAIPRQDIEQARLASHDANRTFGPTTPAAAAALMAAHRIAR